MPYCSGKELAWKLGTGAGSPILVPSWQPGLQCHISKACHQSDCGSQHNSTFLSKHLLLHHPENKKNKIREFDSLGLRLKFWTEELLKTIPIFPSPNSTLTQDGQTMITLCSSLFFSN